jgi:hypothetical protein
MRYLVGLVLLLLALGTLRMVGCGGEQANPCDDGNQCTFERYVSDRCMYWDRHGEVCDFDGAPGRCSYTACVEDLCINVNCDDGDICSEDRCDFNSGECFYYNAGLEGETCTRNGLQGICSNVYCRTFDCADEDCDDGDLCTDDWCIVRELEGARYDECMSFPINCQTGSVCTQGSCDSNTGTCIQTPVSDGVHCCLKYEPPPFCFSIGGCPDECVGWGICQNGFCVVD